MIVHESQESTGAPFGRGVPPGTARGRARAALPGSDDLPALERLVVLDCGVLTEVSSEGYQPTGSGLPSS
jgi:hypothetical protein